MTTFFSTSILSGIALAGALTASLLAGAEPAEAKRMSCIQKYRACNQRCAASVGAHGSWVPCITRTCNRHYDNCVGGY
jgi:hypothetical protein